MNSTLKNYFVVSVLTMTFALSPCALHAQAEKDFPIATTSKNVRILRNNDGSYTEFSKSSDDRVIFRKTYGAAKGGNGHKVLRMCVIYRKDLFGRMRSGKIYDGAGKLLYRVVYGYHRKTGKLIAEDMFDARVKRTKAIRNPTTGKLEEREIPVRRLYHRYDAQGRRAKPIVFCAPAGKLAEELFGKNKGSYIDDPWGKK